MKKIYLFLTVIYLSISAQAQYISLTQLPDNSCPIVCPGSTIVLEVYQIQNLNVGDTVQALFSNSSGSFGSGTTTLSCTQYSLNLGSTWVNGPYIFSSNVSNLYFEITIPSNFPAGTMYTIEMKSSSGYVSSGLFRCSSSNAYITVTPAYTILAPLPANSVGNNQWIGSVYTWNTIIPQSTVLNTPSLISQVNFFDSTNYQGYFLLDSLPFNINYQAATGGTCPGTPGILNNGTSIPCSEGWLQFFSIRLERTENFLPGMYQLSVAADDGIRLSIDGGNTWLLNTFYEEKYDTSYRSTASLYPNGICLSGPTHLVVEYFQRYVDAIVTFSDSLISSNSATINNPGSQSGCTGSDVAFNLNDSGSLTYEWYYSTNGGSSFVPVPNSSPFSGVDSSTLHIIGLPLSYNDYLFQCEVSGVCSSPVTTPVDTLFVGGNGTPATVSGDKNPICSDDSAHLCASAGTSYLWNTGATTQCIYASEAGDYYATVTYNTGCTGESNHYFLQVYPVQSVSIIVSGDTLSSYGAVSYQWLLNNQPINGATQPVCIANQNGAYSVQITDTNGCTEISSQVSIGSVGAGINELTGEAAFTVYPNPVTDNGSLIVITAPQFEGQPLRLFDAEGRLTGIWLVNNTKTELPISTSAKGVYFLKLEEAVKRVVKE